VIEVRNIVKTREGVRVLDDVSITIEAGTQLGLIGPGGAGKSLLVKVIAGLVKPDSGQVFVDGQEITSLGAIELARARNQMGMLFQNYALFDFMTVEENVAFPLRQAGELPDDEIRRRVDGLLRAVGLPNTQHLYPNELSGGMKKRVTFARAVIRDPMILFYDDPTAGLDPVTSSKIFILLERRWKEFRTTSIVISHDILGMKDYCDRFAMIDAGALIFHGSRAEIDACDDARVARFWRGEADE
jgi:phospholipid/cholesterol/gamma-HCH transport system ATP-binding protein